jgi:outer membrane protein OmpA-like peptidoglycan-associated protein
VRPARPDPSVIVDRAALPPPRASPAVTVPAGDGAALAFPPGSAALTAAARAVVARFAAGRGGAGVRVTGYRDAAGGDLGLALARAQAVAQALRAAGLPADAIELAAEPRAGPAGRGAEIRLVYSP